MPDIVIKNGTVIDGSGAPRFKADVVVTGDKIEAVGEFTAKNGCKTIDAMGKIVCPGIIDPHSHADMTIYRKDHVKVLAPLVRQGITTFVGGNCGMAMAPVGENNYELLKLYVESFTAKSFDKHVQWSGMGSFIEHLETNGIALNTALLAPHGLIRIDAMGFENRHATKEEVDHMCRILDDCMEAGAIGLSTGLQYMPGLNSDQRELLHLGKVVGKYDGMYTSHLRSYMSTLSLAVDEIIRMAMSNEIRTQVSHIFWVPDMGAAAPLIQQVMRLLINISKYYVIPMELDTEIRRQLEKIERLRDRGVHIGMDVMPTTTSFTHMLAFFPPWVLQGTKEEIISRFYNIHKRKEILYDILHGDGAWPHTGRNSWSLNLFKIMGWDNIRIMSVVTEDNKRFEGRSIAEIASTLNKKPFDAVCDLLVEEDGKVLVFGSMGEPEDEFTEQSIFAALKHPEVAISTDTILMGFGKPSYLFYGCYPKFLGRYVRDKKMLDLETAVRKITGLPAEHFRLKGRGFVKEGGFADLMVFDPETIEPNCNFATPMGEPVGIDHVFINGAHVFDGARLDLSGLPGRVLKRGDGAG